MGVSDLCLEMGVGQGEEVSLYGSFELGGVGDVPYVGGGGSSRGEGLNN